MFVYLRSADGAPQLTLALSPLPAVGHKQVCQWKETPEYEINGGDILIRGLCITVLEWVTGGDAMEVAAVMVFICARCWVSWHQCGTWHVAEAVCWGHFFKVTGVFISVILVLHPDSPRTLTPLGKNIVLHPLPPTPPYLSVWGLTVFKGSVLVYFL